MARRALSPPRRPSNLNDPFSRPRSPDFPSTNVRGDGEIPFAVLHTRAVRDGEAVLVGEAGNGEGEEGGTVRTEGRALCLLVRGLGFEGDREHGVMGRRRTSEVEA